MALHVQLIAINVDITKQNALSYICILLVVSSFFEFAVRQEGAYLTYRELHHFK